MAEDPRHSRRAQLDPAVLNQQLMLSLVRQHELTESAQMLNEQLQAEIHARKRVEEALISSEKLASVGRMAAVLAHEINNPLESVTNLLYIARTQDGLPDSVCNYLETADAELRRIAHITRQTLSFYRETVAPVTFHVATLMDSVVDLLQAKITSTQAKIILQCDRELEITALQGELRQVFSNFVRNSLDAISQGGTVALRISTSDAIRDRRCVRVTVSDNGHGIGSAALPNIFRPFFTTKGTIGNGLGLWVSKQIIEKHGGSVQLRSRTSGLYRGTTFSVLLPLAPL